MDPISLRRAKSSSTLNKPPKSPSTPKPKLSSKWVPFSQRDSSALEKAYQVKYKNGSTFTHTRINNTTQSLEPRCKSKSARQ